MRRNAKIALAVGGVGLVGLYVAARVANRPKELPAAAAGRPTTLIPTYYKLSEASHFTGPQEVLRDRRGNRIADVPHSFMVDFCVEGSGKLADGRIVNWSSGTSHGGVCTAVVLDRTRYPWGAGAGGRVLVPLRSIAIDPRTMPYGTRVYIRAFDGMQIPAIDGLGGFRHDGWFRADDLGGAIRGNRVDIFAGTSAMLRALDRAVPSFSHLESVIAMGAHA